MRLRKAAEMALGVLLDPKTTADEVADAVKTIRQALAQPEQEPVGYVTIENISSWAQVPSIKWFKKPTKGPLYTAPPKREWVGLTHDEVDSWELPDSPTVFEFAQFIEAKLKEKNSV